MSKNRFGSLGKSGKLSKRVLSLLLIVSLLLPVQPAAFMWAEETDASGNGVDIPSNAVHITNDNILSINWAQTGNYFVLDEDIYLTANWIPIGDFAGSVFDGQGYSINNMNISATDNRRFAGFFGQLIATQDIIIKNVRINIGMQGVAATYNNINYNSNETCAGGLIGSFTGGYSLLIENCYVTGDITASSIGGFPYVYAGGLIGFCSGSGQRSISKCYSTSNVAVHAETALYGVYSYAGGLVGRITKGKISNCYATGNIKNTCIGEMGPGGMGDANACSGGLIGEILYGVSVEYCYATGDVAGRKTHEDYNGGYIDPLVPVSVGGLVGYNDYDYEIISCYRLNSQNLIKDGGVISDYRGTPVSANQLQNLDVYANDWDFVNIWKVNQPNFPTFLNPAVLSVVVSPSLSVIAPGQTQQFYAVVIVEDGAEQTVNWSVYGNASPATTIDSNGLLRVSQDEIAKTLTIQATSIVNPNAVGTAIVSVRIYSNGFLAPIGPIEDGSIGILNRMELDKIGRDPAYPMNGKYCLFDDIDLSDGMWTPIGDADNPFTGVFDGQGCMISNLRIDGDCQYAGLFGYIQDASIKNIGLKEIYIDTNSSITIYAGGVFGYGSDRGDAAISISNCYCSGTISCFSRAGSYGGGICGISYSDNTDISYCYNKSNISAIHGGGICGVNQRGNISINSCFNTGDLSSSSAGGICGINKSGSIVINQCYNTGNVSCASSSASYSGGICGISEYSIISDCYNTGIISSSAGSYSALYNGGICGFDTNGVISNCYNANEVSGVAPYETSTFVGGICGGSASILNNCYWNSDAGQTVNGMPQEPKKGVGYGTDTTSPLTATQMTGAANRANYTDFDFDGVWGYKMPDNDGYPILRVFYDGVDPLPPILITTELSGGKIGDPYYNALEAEGDGLITFSIDREFLPEGLALSAEGVISGTPVIAGTYSFLVKAENEAGTDSRWLSITIEPQTILGGIDTDKSVVVPPDGSVPAQSAPVDGNGDGQEFSLVLIHNGDGFPDGFYVASSRAAVDHYFFRDQNGEWQPLGQQINNNAALAIPINDDTTKDITGSMKELKLKVVSEAAGVSWIAFGVDAECTASYARGISFPDGHDITHIIGFQRFAITFTPPGTVRVDIDVFGYEYGFSVNDGIRTIAGPHRPVNGSYILTATVKTSSGVSVNGAEVSFYIAQGTGATLATIKATTNAAGKAYNKLYGSRPDIITVRARVGGVAIQTDPPEGFYLTDVICVPFVEIDDAYIYTDIHEYIVGQKEALAKPLIIPISIVNNPGLAAFQMNIYYDSAALTAVTVESGDVWNGSVTSNMSVPGKVTIAGSTASLKTGDGQIVLIEFDVGPEAVNTIYPILVEIEVLRTLNDFSEQIDIPATVFDGAVVLSSVIRGDVYEDGRIDASDSTEVLLHLAELKTLTVRQQTAAKVTGFGNSVNIIDANEILRIAVGLSAPPPPFGTRLDHAATVIQAASSSADAVDLSVGSASGSVGDIVTIPVSISNNTGISAFDIKIEYDETRLTPTNVENGSAWLEELMVNLSPSGGEYISVGSISTENRYIDGTIVNVSFTIKSDAPAGDACVRLIIDEFGLGRVNGAGGMEPLEFFVSDGLITVNGGTGSGLIYGDVTDDGVIDMQDVLLIYQCFRGRALFSEEQMQAADVNRDGVVDMQDVLLVYQYFRGRISGF